jgi:diguanylate cyclase (GGDEF)-like protein
MENEVMNLKFKYGDKLFTKTEDKHIEILMFIGAIISPSFVFIWDIFIPGKPVHLKWASWIISLLFTFVYRLLYISSSVRRHLRYYFYTLCYIVSAYVIYLAYFNNFSKEYLLALMLVVFYMSLTFDKMRSLLYYLMTTLLLIGLAIYMERNYKNVYDNTSKIIVICFFVFSIMALFNLLVRNNDKREINESRKDYKRLLDTSPNGILVYQEERVVYANEAIVRLAKFNDKDSIVGKSFSELLSPKDNEMAFYDAVTKLPNRYFLNCHLENSLESSKDSGQPVALLFIDLDKLKLVNDTMGHSFGDKVLNQASLEIKKCLFENDFIARYESDAFIVVLENASEDLAEQTAQKIIKRFSNQLTIEDHIIDITLSIGISFYPKDSSDAETLLKYADIAMYEVKSQGRNNYIFYKSEMSNKILRKIQVENGLKKSLQNDEFIIHYQPQIDFATGDILGVEALIRWKHPEFGIFPPNEFIPIAEETGLIVPIGEWVLRTACMQSTAWQKSGLRPINLAVNVSYQQLKYNGFINSIQEILKDSGLEPKHLELEVTESILRDAEELKLVLDELSPLGIKLSIDDFGVGYSSLSLLQHVVVNNIKIDMSFIRGIPESSKAAAVVKTIINMGKNINCNITAEGVEAKEQANFLRENNCDLGQGYLFSQPLDAKDFERLLREWKSI